MKMMLAQTNMPSQRGQIRLIGMALIQILDDACNPFVIVHACTLPLVSITTTRFLPPKYDISTFGRQIGL